MVLVALVAGLIVFIAVLRGLQVQRHASHAVKTAQDAIGVIADPGLSDDVKEKHVQRASLSLLKSFVILVAIGLLACLCASLFVAGGGLFGLFSIDQALATATSWSFILWSSVGAVALWIILGKLGGRSGVAKEGVAKEGGAKEAGAKEAGAKEDRLTAREEVPYSTLDKALHNYAFSSPALQVTLSSIEDRLWRKKIATTRTGRPVFITSLPRAGTTILLELLARQDEFASTTYRNMPFTLAPLLWGRFSSMFRKAGEKAERAHGDGIAVDFDSPEAFEEMIWMAFWRERYEKECIRLWEVTDRDAEFEAFLARHMQKLVASVPAAQRYVSKNNANIARLPLLSAAFPEAQVLIPIRDPASQVASLKRQHTRFSDLHARDRFAQQYMEGIGHFEFGAALRPIAFPGAPESADGAGHADYWLRYWIAAYEHVLRTASAETVFVDHIALSRRPDVQLPRLAEALGISDRERFLAASSMFRAPASPPELPGASPDLLRLADELYAALLERTL